MRNPSSDTRRLPQLLKPLYEASKSRDDIEMVWQAIETQLLSTAEQQNEFRNEVDAVSQGLRFKLTSVESKKNIVKLIELRSQVPLATKRANLWVQYLIWNPELLLADLEEDTSEPRKLKDWLKQQLEAEKDLDGARLKPALLSLVRAWKKRSSQNDVLVSLQVREAMAELQPYISGLSDLLGSLPALAEEKASSVEGVTPVVSGPRARSDSVGSVQQPTLSPGVAKRPFQVQPTIYEEELAAPLQQRGSKCKGLKQAKALVKAEAQARAASRPVGMVSTAEGVSFPGFSVQDADQFLKHYMPHESCWHDGIYTAYDAVKNYLAKGNSSHGAQGTRFALHLRVKLFEQLARVQQDPALRDDAEQRIQYELDYLLSKNSNDLKPKSDFTKLLKSLTYLFSGQLSKKRGEQATIKTAIKITIEDTLNIQGSRPWPSQEECAQSISQLPLLPNRFSKNKLLSFLREIKANPALLKKELQELYYHMANQPAQAEIISKVMSTLEAWVLLETKRLLEDRQQEEKQASPARVSEESAGLQYAAGSCCGDGLFELGSNEHVGFVVLKGQAMSDGLQKLGYRPSAMASFAEHLTSPVSKLPLTKAAKTSNLSGFYVDLPVIEALNASGGKTEMHYLQRMVLMLLSAANQSLQTLHMPLLESCAPAGIQVHLIKAAQTIAGTHLKDGQRLPTIVLHDQHSLAFDIKGSTDVNSRAFDIEKAVNDNAEYDPMKLALDNAFDAVKGQLGNARHLAAQLKEIDDSNPYQGDAIEKAKVSSPSAEEKADGADKNVFVGEVPQTLETRLTQYKSRLQLGNKHHRKTAARLLETLQKNRHEYIGADGLARLQQLLQEEWGRVAGADYDDQAFVHEDLDNSVAHSVGESESRIEEETQASGAAESKASLAADSEVAKQFNFDGTYAKILKDSYQQAKLQQAILVRESTAPVSEGETDSANELYKALMAGDIPKAMQTALRSYLKKEGEARFTVQGTSYRWELTYPSLGLPEITFTNVDQPRWSMSVKVTDPILRQLDLTTSDFQQEKCRKLQDHIRLMQQKQTKLDNGMVYHWQSDLQQAQQHGLDYSSSEGESHADMASPAYPSEAKGVESNGGENTIGAESTSKLIIVFKQEEQEASDSNVLRPIYGHGAYPSFDYRSVLDVKLLNGSSKRATLVKQMFVAIAHSVNNGVSEVHLQLPAANKGAEVRSVLQAAKDLFDQSSVRGERVWPTIHVHQADMLKSSEFDRKPASTNKVKLEDAEASYYDFMTNGMEGRVYWLKGLEAMLESNVSFAGYVEDQDQPTLHNLIDSHAGALGIEMPTVASDDVLTQYQQYYEFIERKLLPAAWTRFEQQGMLTEGQAQAYLLNLQQFAAFSVHVCDRPDVWQAELQAQLHTGNEEAAIELFKAGVENQALFASFDRKTVRQNFANAFYQLLGKAGGVPTAVKMFEAVFMHPSISSLQEQTLAMLVAMHAKGSQATKQFIQPLWAQATESLGPHSPRVQQALQELGVVDRKRWKDFPDCSITVFNQLSGFIKNQNFSTAKSLVELVCSMPDTQDDVLDKTQFEMLHQLLHCSSADAARKECIDMLVNSLGDKLGDLKDKENKNLLHWLAEPTIAKNNAFLFGRDRSEGASTEEEKSGSRETASNRRITDCLGKSTLEQMASAKDGNKKRPLDLALNHIVNGVAEQVTKDKQREHEARKSAVSGGFFNRRVGKTALPVVDLRSLGVILEHAKLTAEGLDQLEKEARLAILNQFVGKSGLSRAEKALSQLFESIRSSVVLVPTPPVPSESKESSEEEQANVAGSVPSPRSAQSAEQAPGSDEAISESNESSEEEKEQAGTPQSSRSGLGGFLNRAAAALWSRGSPASPASDSSTSQTPGAGRR